MSVQGAILESLRVKRESTVYSKTNTVLKPISQVIGESKTISFILSKSTTSKATTHLKTQAKRLNERTAIPTVSIFNFTGEPKTHRLTNPSIVLYSNGDKYIGEIKDGVPDGYGTITSTETGDMFDGQWVNGVQHGRGIYLWSDGDFTAGVWKNGYRHGKGTRYEDGILYQEEWDNGNLLTREGSICEKVINKKK